MCTCIPVLCSWWFAEQSPSDTAYCQLTKLEKKWIDSIAGARKRAIAVCLMPPEIALLPTIEQDMADMHLAWLDVRNGKEHDLQFTIQQ